MLLAYKRRNRYLSESIDEVINRKMVFIGGPRQVGKTTLSLNYLNPSSVENPQYLNWDRLSDKSAILRVQIPLQSKTVVLNEVYKYKKWRNLLKGLFDKYQTKHRFLVIGSARQDHFRKGGDSLFGRYRYFRLHPFSVMELNGNPKRKFTCVKGAPCLQGFHAPHSKRNKILTSSISIAK